VAIITCYNSCGAETALLIWSHILCSPMYVLVYPLVCAACMLIRLFNYLQDSTWMWILSAYDFAAVAQINSTDVNFSLYWSQMQHFVFFSFKKYTSLCKCRQRVDGPGNLYGRCEEKNLCQPVNGTWFPVVQSVSPLILDRLHFNQDTVKRRTLEEVKMKHRMQ
jgi:hypothetical protein